MEIYTKFIGNREFLVIGRVAIPVDRITSIDFEAPNGGSTNSVRIHTDNDEERYIWAYKNADAIRTFFGA